MIETSAYLNAADTAAHKAVETLREKIAQLEKPLGEFGTFLEVYREVPAAADVPIALSGLFEPAKPAGSQAGPSTSSVPPDADAPQQTAPLPEVGDSGGLEQSEAAAPVGEKNGEYTPVERSGGPPRFTHVPEAAKYPAGPYRQAPTEYGGEWWLVNPFTGNEPWRTHSAADGSASGAPELVAESLPEGFSKTFGEMPAHRPGESGTAFASRLGRWKQDLQFFQRTGVPDGFGERQVELAGAVYEQWGMGRPAFYEGRYGWFARFPDSAIPEFEMDAASAVEATHLAIARFQARLLREGGEVATPHPFVPLHLFET